MAEETIQKRPSFREIMDDQDTQQKIFNAKL